MTGHELQSVYPLDVGLLLAAPDQPIQAASCEVLGHQEKVANVRPAIADKQNEALVPAVAVPQHGELPHIGRCSALRYWPAVLDVTGS